MRIPASYFAAAGDEPTEYVMVLEDLDAAGCTFTTAWSRTPTSTAASSIEALARLHARFWDDPRFDDELSWVQPAMRGAFGAQLVDSAREQFGADLPPVFTELCQLYVRAPRADHRAVGRGRADPDPRRHPHREPVRRRRRGRPLRLGRAQPLTRHPRRRHLPRQLVPHRAAPRRPGGLDRAPTTRRSSTRASTRRRSTSSGCATAGRCSTPGWPPRRPPRWAASGNRSRSACPA